MNRLNHQEIAEVARLVAQRGMRAQGMGATSGQVAAALGLSASEVEAMLHDIRLRNGGVPLANPAIERRTVFLALGTVAALLIVAAFALLRGSFGGTAPTPVAAVPGTPAPSPVPAVPYPLGSPATAHAVAPVAQNSPEPMPSGLAPQVQDPGEARALTNGSEMRRAVDQAARVAGAPRYAVTQ